MDWYESELEDALAQNLMPLMETLYMFYPSTNVEIGLLGRQVPCRYGIIDLLWYSTLPDANVPFYSIHVTELKAVKATVKTVEQVTRYAEAIKEVNFYDPIPNSEFMDYAHLVDNWYGIFPVIVAPEYDASIDWFQNRVIAAKTGNGFELSHAGGTAREQRLNTPLEQCLLPLIKRVIESAQTQSMMVKLQKGLDSITVRTTGK